MKKVSIFTSVLGLLAISLSGTVLADGHESDAPPPLSDVWMMVPKTGMEAKFAEAVAKHQAMRAEMGDARTWQVYAPVLGKKLNVYAFRYCCFDWADQDDYVNSEHSEAFGEHWNANVHQYVDHYHHYFDRMDWESSHWPEGQQNGPFYGVTEWTLKADASPATNEARKAISQIAKDGWASAENNWLWMSRIGGGDSFSVVSSYASYADMAPPEQDIFEFVAEKAGEEKAGELFGGFASQLSSSDYTIWKHVPEMSTPTDD